MLIVFNEIKENDKNDHLNIFKAYYSTVECITDNCDIEVRFLLSLKIKMINKC